MGVVIEKGRPHKSADEVLWARCATDGHAKVKGNRLRSDRVQDLLAVVAEDVKATIRNRNHTVKSVPGIIKKGRLDCKDSLCELLPQVYLDEPEPMRVRSDLQHAVREYLAFLIRTSNATTFSAALTSGKVKPQPKSGPPRFKLFSLTDLFGAIDEGIHKGSIHALNVENFGRVPVVSSSTDHNGIMGFYDLDSDWKRFRHVISVASNGTPLTSYYHPYEIVPKDDVFICVPPNDFPLASIFYTITALNAVTWRFSYYRKAYMNKLDKISIYMPILDTGKVDHDWLKDLIESCDGWAQLKAGMDTWQPQPFASLGRRPTAQPLPSDDKIVS